FTFPTMAIARRHVLRATDKAFKAFLESELSPETFPAAQIVRHKEVTDKQGPIIVCATENGTRKRAKNWVVTGSLIIKTESIGEPEQEQSNLDTSDALEAALLDALEQYI